MTESYANLPRVVSRDEWTAARKELLIREKQFTRQRDALSADRRRLPMVRIEKEYVFEGPDDPSWEEGCPSCSAGAAEVSDGLLRHLHARDTTFVYVSRAPLEKIEAYKASKGWTFPWYSSYGSDFNYDFHATLDESVAPVEYNFQTIDDQDAQSAEVPGRSSFLREGDSVFHTYSVYARGLETVGGSYYFLEETALGRQEDWEEPKGRAADARGAVPDFSS